jgi:hypothetical protein
MVMDEVYEYFLSIMGPEFNKTQPTEAQIAKFSGKLPRKLLEYWHDYGWGGFYDGLFWLTDPEEYASSVEAWLASTNIPDKQNYLAIARSAFGRIFLWNKKTGQNITIISLDSLIITSAPDEDVAAGDDTDALQDFLCEIDPDYLDMQDTRENNLFKRVLRKLGPVAVDEMYCFEPALAIGGSPILGNIAIVKIIPQLIFLAQLGDVEILHIDVSKIL